MNLPRKPMSALIASSLFVAFGLAFLVGMHGNSATAQGDLTAQNDNSGPMGGRRGNTPVPPGMQAGRVMGNGTLMTTGPAYLAASGAFVYVLRGNTLYQLRTSDLSIVAHRELPVPTPPRPPGGRGD